MTSAYIFLDVDGVLNPYSNRPGKGWKYDNGIWFKPGLGAALLSIARKYDAEIVWLTAWEDRANRHISPLNGLPDDLRVVRVWPKGEDDWRLTFGQVKARQLRNWLRRHRASNVPFIWIDDEPDATSALRNLMGSRGYVVATDPDRGIRPADLVEADQALARQLRKQVA